MDKIKEIKRLKEKLLVHYGSDLGITETAVDLLVEIIDILENLQEQMNRIDKCQSNERKWGPF
jgi:hypothetical protein